MSKNPMLNLPGTMAGNDKAIRQHQAIARGYGIAEEEAGKVETNGLLTKGKTGCANLAGFSKKR